MDTYNLNDGYECPQLSHKVYCARSILVRYVGIKLIKINSKITYGSSLCSRLKIKFQNVQSY